MTFTEEWINRPEDYSEMTDGERAAYWFAKGEQSPQTEQAEASNLNALLNAVQEVVECLALENMQRPAFTFRRIRRLAEVFEQTKSI